MLDCDIPESYSILFNIILNTNAFYIAYSLGMACHVKISISKPCFTKTRTGFCFKVTCKNYLILYEKQEIL